MNKKCDDFIKDYVKLKKELADMTVEERNHVLNCVIEIEGKTGMALLIKKQFGL